MSRQQHVVQLTEAERAHCGTLLRRGHTAALTQRRARILLLADRHAGAHWTDAEVAAAVLVDPRTVARVRSEYATAGLRAALGQRPRRRPLRRKLDGAAEAHLVTLACSTPPVGRARWTLRLLAAELVSLEIVDGISPETVRTTLKKTSSNPG